MPTSRKQRGQLLAYYTADDNDDEPNPGYFVLFALILPASFLLTEFVVEYWLFMRMGMLGKPPLGPWTKRHGFRIYVGTFLDQLPVALEAFVAFYMGQVITAIWCRCGSRRNAWLVALLVFILGAAFSLGRWGIELLSWYTSFQYPGDYNWVGNISACFFIGGFVSWWRRPHHR